MKTIPIDRAVLEQALMFVHCTGWSDLRDSTIDAIQAALTQASEPAPVQDSQPVKYLANGIRFKLSLDDEGKVSCFWNCEELDGRWVALVAAEDDCHLHTTPQPQPSESAAIDALAAERDALKADAARYRWAVKNARWIRHEHEAYVAIPVARSAHLLTYISRTNAIDAAMKEAP